MARVYPNSMITALPGRDGCLVYYMIRRNIYARRYIVPRYPDTPAQRKRRTLFAEAVNAFTISSIPNASGSAIQNPQNSSFLRIPNRITLLSFLSSV